LLVSVVLVLVAAAVSALVVAFASWTSPVLLSVEIASLIALVLVFVPILALIRIPVLLLLSVSILLLPTGLLLACLLIKPTKGVEASTRIHHLASVDVLGALA